MPPVIVAVAFPSQEPLHNASFPVIETTIAFGSVMLIHNVSGQLLSSSTTTP